MLSWLSAAWDRPSSARKSLIGVGLPRHFPLVLIQYALGAEVHEDSILAYAWVNLAGANSYDVSDLKEIIEGSLSQEEISKA